MALFIFDEATVEPLRTFVPSVSALLNVMTTWSPSSVCFTLNKSKLHASPQLLLDAWLHEFSDVNYFSVNFLLLFYKQSLACLLPDFLPTMS